MKLTSATMAPAASPMSCGRQVARVDALAADDARVGGELRVELAVADVDGEDLDRAAFEQHLGEAAGRGADVERHEALRRIAEAVERGDHLEAAARDVAARRIVERDRRVGLDGGRRPRHQLAR